MADERIPADKAGYMELVGAYKDAECTLVDVKGGVAKQLGCCNHFDPKQGAAKFSCGTCSMVRKA